ncbi:DUF6731 family protein [Parathalassolituus penaei]|uniref:Uncharacterized protein n=1 Tax=Parathalassolituus penaei TaxID=2997323 RepID=A0A9X3EEI6_9GAMM|nr:DUF6731 family protein [Parathalassolituus penaei]MCY0966138.1 hypothetical protein [Parathalassolituus penaei]
MPDTKVYNVSFYTVFLVDGTDNPPKLSQVFDGIVSGGDLPCEVYNQVEQMTYQLRDVMRMVDGRFRGVFAKFRSNDLPKIGSRFNNGQDGERPIDLRDDEGLLEKNYFLYDPRMELLIFQVNGQGTKINKTAEILTGICSDKTGTIVNVFLSPVLRPDAIRRILDENIKPTKLKVSFARPTNPDIYKSDMPSFSNGLLDLLSSSDGANLTLTISANGRGRSSFRNFLSDSVKLGLVHLSDTIPVATSQLWFDESADPIDLVEDRIKGITDPVEQDGKYPKIDSIFSALDAVYRRYADEIKQVLAVGDGGVR